MLCQDCRQRTNLWCHHASPQSPHILRSVDFSKQPETWTTAWQSFPSSGFFLLCVHRVFLTSITADNLSFLVIVWVTELPFLQSHHVTILRTTLHLHFKKIKLTRTIYYCTHPSEKKSLVYFHSSSFKLQKAGFSAAATGPHSMVCNCLYMQNPLLYTQIK